MGFESLPLQINGTCGVKVAQESVELLVLVRVQSGPSIKNNPGRRIKVFRLIWDQETVGSSPAALKRACPRWF